MVLMLTSSMIKSRLLKCIEIKFEGEKKKKKREREETTNHVSNAFEVAWLSTECWGQNRVVG